MVVTSADSWSFKTAKWLAFYKAYCDWSGLESRPKRALEAANAKWHLERDPSLGRFLCTHFGPGKRSQEDEKAFAIYAPDRTLNGDARRGLIYSLESLMTRLFKCATGPRADKPARSRIHFLRGRPNIMLARTL